jgi:hypothetical protein
VTQCRFRFGDGSEEAFDDDCNLFHSYSMTGSPEISCEVRAPNGQWKAAGACGGRLEIVAAPTATPEFIQPQVLGAETPQEQPKTGYSVMWMMLLIGLGVTGKLLLAV